MKEGKPSGASKFLVRKSWYNVLHPLLDIFLEHSKFVFFSQTERHPIPQHSSPEYKALPVKPQLRVLHDDVPTDVILGEYGGQVLWFFGQPNSEDSDQSVVGNELLHSQPP